MGNISYENLFSVLNKIKGLANFLVRAIRRIIHSVGLDRNP
jgi:endonuclease III